MPTPLPTLPAVYYGYIKGTYGTLTVGNTAAFQATVSATTAAADLARAQVIADAMVTSWTTTLGPLQPDNVTGWDSRVYPLEFPTSPAALGHVVGTGGNTGILAPVSSAAVIRHTVMRRGRGSQSHSAFSPLTVNEIDGDGLHITAGLVTGLTTEWENWIAGIQAATAAATVPFFVNYVQLSKKGTGAVYPILSTAAESLLGTERSRTPRP